MQTNKFIHQFCLLLFFVSLSWAQLGTDTTGGPDTYGHYWITSNAIGETIEFDWLDARSGIRANFAEDDTSGAINIGFPFNFYGTDYTQIYISTGGVISFDPFTQTPDVVESANNNGVPNVALPNNIIAAGWNNIRPDTNNVDSDVYYQLMGSAPYRKFVIQWYYFEHDDDVANFNFQIVLYETTNLIIYNYGIQSGPSQYDSSQRLIQTGTFNTQCDPILSPFSGRPFLGYL